jgi:hypothetical protein
MEAEAKRLLVERDNARHEAQLAQLQSAEMSGKLSAIVEEREKHPATRPAGVLARIASALAEE